jgi:formamidopyrimidine-DNA glycosylase
MSVELPEAQILAEQMNEVLLGKQIEACHVRDYERMQRIGFMNKDIGDYEEFVDGRIESVASRGNTILILMKLDNGMNLLIAPEYGGVVLYHASEEAATEKYHLRVDFTDGTVLTVRLTSMGVIQAVGDDGLEASYVYRRDFSERLSPADEGQFTLERFSELLSRRNQQLKPVLVGKDAARTPSWWGSATAPSRTSSTGRGSTRRGGPPSSRRTRGAPSTMR